MSFHMTSNQELALLDAEYKSYQLANQRALECEVIIKRHITDASDARSTFLLRGMSHDLMRYVSNYFLERSEGSAVSFPSLNARFLRNPYLIDFESELPDYRYGYSFRERSFVELSPFHHHENMFERIIAAVLTRVFRIRLLNILGTLPVDSEALHLFNSDGNRVE